MACYCFANSAVKSLKSHTEWAEVGWCWLGVPVALGAIVELKAQLELVFLLFIAHKMECKLPSLPATPHLSHGVPWLFRWWVNRLLGCWVVPEEKGWR